MAWNHIQSNSGSVSTGSTVTAAYTTGLSSGSKLIAIVCLSTDDITAPTVTSVSDGTNNFTKRVDQTMVGAAGWLSWWDLDTPAGDVGATPTITATKAAAANDFGFSILIQEVSGLATGAAFDGTAGAQSGSTTPAGTAAYSSTALNEYLVTVYGDSGSGNTIGNPTSGYTADAKNVNTSTNANLIVGYKNSSNGAESASFTNAATSWATILVAYKLAAGAAAPNGTLQPRATVPVPRRRLARAIVQHITGQPPPATPNRQPPPGPRPRPPRRAWLQHITGQPPPAVTAGAIAPFTDDDRPWLKRHHVKWYRQSGPLDWWYGSEIPAGVATAYEAGGRVGDPGPDAPGEDVAPEIAAGSGLPGAGAEPDRRVRRRAKLRHRGRGGDSAGRPVWTRHDLVPPAGDSFDLDRSQRLGHVYRLPRPGWRSASEYPLPVVQRRRRRAGDSGPDAAAGRLHHLRLVRRPPRRRRHAAGHRRAHRPGPPVTIPGAGGQPPPRPDQQAAVAIPVPVAPGSPAVIRARQVIVSGPTGSIVGVFVYAAGTTPGAGNQPIASMTNQTADPFTNATEPGVAAYVTIASGAAAGGPYAIQLGQVTVSGTPAPGLFIHNLPAPASIDPGIVAISKTSGCEAVMGSGAATGASTEAAVVAADSTLSGVAGGQVSLVAGAVTLDNSASATIPTPSAGITTVAQVVTALKNVGIFS